MEYYRPDFVQTLFSSKYGNMLQYHLPCQGVFYLFIYFLAFSGVMSCCVVVLLTPGELFSTLLSSFSSAQLITWHSTRNQVTPLDVNLWFLHSCHQMSAQLVFDMICHHKAPSPSLLSLFLSNWPVVVTGKLNARGNVVCRSSLIISLPALTIHNGTLAVTVT